MRTHHKPLDRGFVLWHPAWDWLRLANVRCYDGCRAISGEWCAFVGRRNEEDLQLGEELAGAPGPAALWAAYRKFWQKAFEDYRRECLALGELYATMVTPSTRAAPQASQRAVLPAKAVEGAGATAALRGEESDDRDWQPKVPTLFGYGVR